MEEMSHWDHLLVSVKICGQCKAQDIAWFGMPICKMLPQTCNKNGDHFDVAKRSSIIDVTSWSSSVAGLPTAALV